MAGNSILSIACPVWPNSCGRCLKVVPASIEITQRRRRGRGRSISNICFRHAGKRKNARTEGSAGSRFDCSVKSNPWLCNAQESLSSAGSDHVALERLLVEERTKIMSLHFHSRPQINSCFGHGAQEGPITLFELFYFLLLPT